MVQKKFNRFRKINFVIFSVVAMVLGIAPLASAADGSINNATDPKGIRAPSERICAQVITNAMFSSGECESFPTPCDVPEGWTIVNSCPIVTDMAIGDIDSMLLQLRKNKEDFKNNKKEEAKENVNIIKEKVVSKKKEIQDRLEKIKQDKEAKRKAVLLNLIDIQIEQLENTKERAGKMLNIKVDLKIDLNTKIDEAIGELEASKIILQGITTQEGLKKFAGELKDSFKSKRDIVKTVVDAILASKTDKTIISAENRLSEIKTKIVELGAAGQGISVFEGLFTVVEEKIAAAGIKAEKKDIKGAVSDLKEAYESMKSIIEKTDSVE